MNRVMARMYDRIFRASEEGGLSDARREVLASAHGAVLEIGAGTGLNLRAYPRTGIDRLVVLEPDANMARHLRARLDDAPVVPEVVQSPAERMPFSDDSFDVVAGTLVLCEPDDPGAVLAEVARVLKPGGTYLFYEHVRSDEAGLARWQDRLSRLWTATSGGCHCNRTTLATIEASPLAVREVRATRFPKAFVLVRPTIAGVAQLPAQPS